VRFSVRWTGVRRVVLWLALLSTGTAGAALIINRWFWPGLGALAGAVVVLVPLRFDIRLVGPRLVRRGLLRRRSIDLRQATFSVKRAALVVLAAGRITVTAPTLVVGSDGGPIKLPLSRRTGLKRVDGDVVPAWLPVEELFALADSVAWFGRAPNKEKVAHFLRTVARSDYEPPARDDPFSASGRIYLQPRSWPTAAPEDDEGDTRYI